MVPVQSGRTTLLPQTSPVSPVAEGVGRLSLAFLQEHESPTRGPHPHDLTSPMGLTSQHHPLGGEDRNF